MFVDVTYLVIFIIISFSFYPLFILILLLFILFYFILSYFFLARNYVRAVSPYFQSLNNLNVIKPFDLSSNTVLASDPNYLTSPTSFLPLSETIKMPLGVLTKENFIGNDINNFDDLNSLNDIIQINGLKNINGNEMINQIDQIVKLNENNFSETVNNVISVSAVELYEKFSSFFRLLNIDMNSFF